MPLSPEPYVWNTCCMKMTTIVGIFDNARDLDKAVERLTRAGFEDTVYDEAIVAEETSNVGRRSLRRALLRRCFGAMPNPI